MDYEARRPKVPFAWCCPAYHIGQDIPSDRESMSDRRKFLRPACGQSLGHPAPLQTNHLVDERDETKRNIGSYCKVPSLDDRERDTWLGYNCMLRKRWKERWENTSGGQDRPGKQSWFARWRSHVLIEADQKIACVQCGRFGTNRKNSCGVLRRNWVHQPCLGCTKLPKGLLLLVEFGCCDSSFEKIQNRRVGRYRCTLKL